jgi:hypothetical protein
MMIVTVSMARSRPKSKSRESLSQHVPGLFYDVVYSGENCHVTDIGMVNLRGGQSVRMNSISAIHELKSYPVDSIIRAMESQSDSERLISGSSFFRRRQLLGSVAGAPEIRGQQWHLERFFESRSL